MKLPVDHWLLLLSDIECYTVFVLATLLSSSQLLDRHLTPVQLTPIFADFAAR